MAVYVLFPYLYPISPPISIHVDVESNQFWRLMKVFLPTTEESDPAVNSEVRQITITRYGDVHNV
jgi:hypothetical protein